MNNSIGGNNIEQYNIGGASIRLNLDDVVLISDDVNLLSPCSLEVGSSRWNVLALDCGRQDVSEQHLA